MYVYLSSVIYPLVNKFFRPGGPIFCCASLLKYKHFLILFFLALFCDVLDAKRVREDFS